MTPKQLLEVKAMPLALQNAGNLAIALHSPPPFSVPFVHPSQAEVASMRALIEMQRHEIAGLMKVVATLSSYGGGEIKNSAPAAGDKPEPNSPSDVRGHAEKMVEHLLHGRVQQRDREQLGKALGRANQDAAVSKGFGRAIGAGLVDPLFPT